MDKMPKTMNDSSERENQLYEENRRLKSIHSALMNNDQCGFLITDSDGTIIELNHTAENLLGQKARSLLGKHIRIIPEVSEYIVEVLEDEKRFEKIELVFGNRVDQASLVDTFPLYDESFIIIGAFIQLLDITEVYRVHEQFNYLSNHDNQTGLPNRNFLKTKLADYMKAIKSHHGKSTLAVIHFGLDRFKIVNDTLGYTGGDELLQCIVQRMKNSSKLGEFIARVGGDEFIVVAPCEDKKETLQVGERYQSIFNEPFAMRGFEFHITASMGIAVYPSDGLTTEELLAKADTTMSYVKKNGKNQFVLYNNKLDPHSHEKIILEASFRKALDLDELILYYQPKIDIKLGIISGVEALVRWRHPEKGLIPPGEFIPMAEEIGLISQLDEWVLREACKQNKKWQGMGLLPISVAVNLSSAQFSSHKLVELVEATLMETGLEPHYLELEITETMTMDASHAIPILKQLNALGVKISLDDFGTGYSSLNYLTKFAIDRLKIDRSFIWNIEKGGSDSNIVMTIIHMAHSLGLKVIAEGVEDDKQLQFLQQHECDEVQGFFYSKPLPPEEVIRKFLSVD